MRYEIIVGVGFDKWGRSIIAPNGLVRKATAEAAHRFGGCTVIESTGAWIDPTIGNPVIESGRMFIIEAHPTAGPRVREFAEYLRDVFDQQSVVLTEFQTNSAFI